MDGDRRRQTAERIGIEPVDESGRSAGQAASDIGRRAYVIPLVFVLLAGWMLIDPWGDVSPIAPAQEVPAEMTDTTPVRQPLLQPETRIGGYMMRCSECHDL